MHKHLHSWALVALGAITTTSSAHAICLVVEDPGTPAPAVLPDQSILFVAQSSVEIPSPCDADTDVGPALDTDAALDTDVSLDTDPVVDSDVSLDTDLSVDTDPLADTDASVDTDAAHDTDASVDPTCASHVGDTVTMVVQPRFATSPDGARFALIMATPAHPWITLQSPHVFEDLERVTARRTVYETTYVEDASLGTQCSDPAYHAAVAADQANQGGGDSSGGYIGGCGYAPSSPGDIDLGTTTDGAQGDGSDDGKDTDATSDSDLSLDDTGVDVVSIGAYEVALLARSDIASVATWLGDHGYAHDEAALDPLKPYVAMGWSVVAVRVAVEGSAMGPLAPIGFSWEGRTMRIPVAIAGARATGDTTLDAYVLSDARAWSFAGGTLRWLDGVTVDGTRPMHLSRTTLTVPAAAAPEADPVATTANGTFHEEEVVPRTVRVPLSDCSQTPAPTSTSETSTSGGPCGCTLAGSGALAGPGMVAFAVAALRRRRRVGAHTM